MQRRRFKQTLPLEQRLRDQATGDRARAASLPPGRERDELLVRARRADTASHLTEWLTSPGLQPPR